MGWWHMWRSGFVLGSGYLGMALIKMYNYNRGRDHDEINAI